MVLLSSKFALAAYVAFITSISASLIQERSNGVHSVKITKPVNNLSAKDLLSKEKARLNSFVIAASTGNAPITNVDASYYVTVSVCGQNFPYMIVDTGSSNIWVDDVPSTCAATCRGTFSGSGVSGTECVGPVTIGGFTAPEQSFGNASSSEFSGADG